MGHSSDSALTLFVRKLQCFSAFTEPVTEALLLDVFSLHMCSSLHQKQRKPQEIAACISRKLNYITSCAQSAQPRIPWYRHRVADEGGDKDQDQDCSSCVSATVSLVKASRQA